MQYSRVLIKIFNFVGLWYIRELDLEIKIQLSYDSTLALYMDKNF